MDIDRSYAAHKLIEATPEVLKVVPDLEVVIVGGGNDYEPIRTEAEEMNKRLGKRVIITTGSRTDINKFAAAVLRGEPLVADGREGINGLSISNAMHLSAWQGREVSLPLSAEDEQAFYGELMERVKTSRRKENVTSTVADTADTFNS